MKKLNFAVLKNGPRLLFIGCLGLIFLLLTPGTSFAADKAVFTVTGKVSNKAGEALYGATVGLEGSIKGTTTDVNGMYSLDLNDSEKNGVLFFSFIGFERQTMSLNGRNVIDVVLSEGNVLNEVVISVGSRASQRTVTNSPLPIDNISAKDLANSGQQSFDYALSFKVPSFNVVNTPVNDATSLLDPYELRNLGSSRTLILINGKRKNPSALVNIQNTLGRGETGVDLSAIPVGAIKNIEVLRDGASAQYGSDAIAGVVNIVLKDKVEYSEATLQSGIYSKGDGALYGVNVNTGSTFGGGKGFVNFNLAFKDQQKTNRSTPVDPVQDNNNLSDGSAASLQVVKDYLAKYPDANNVNGSPAVTSANFLVNAAIPVGDGAQVYGNGAFVFKRVLSNANFRTPYWKPDYGLLHDPGTTYIGYNPTFDGNLTDYNATIGFKNTTNSGWLLDLSGTTGGNAQIYYVNNTVNHSLGALSPTSFRPGGYAFSNNIFNADISKQITDNFALAFGSEARNENYSIIAGDTASYYGAGANSFPGIRSDIAGNFTRFNVGLYADASWDITKEWQLNGTVRTEKYSDFGSAFVWKASTRYTISDALTLRGSISTGFKAPSLQQLNLQVSQASFVGGTIQLQGIFSNHSPIVRLLGVPVLKPETSTNYTAGIGLNLSKQFSVTVDYYNIEVDNRILLSSNVSGAKGTVLGNILVANNVVNASFFINGLNSSTQGVDFVASYRRIPVGGSSLNVSLAANYNHSDQIGTANTPAAISAAGTTIFNGTESALALTSRPEYKGILGLELNLNKQFTVSLNNTLVGPATFRNIDLINDVPNATLVFDPKLLTDVVVNYNFTKMVGLSVAVQNIFNVIPSYKLNNLGGFSDYQARQDISFDGRYSTTGYDSNHISILGTNFLGQLTVKF